MMDQLSTLLPQILQIIWINILLSGDNAVVIALACRGLPDSQRNIGIALGAGAAIVLRIIFTLMTTQLMGLPWLKAIGAIALLWIAVKLIVPEEASEDSVAGHDSLWKAVQTVAIADVVMSLDNVIAIAAAAKGHTGLIIFGLVVSIPLVIAGSSLLMKVIDRFPVLVWAGAALLGWIAGELFVEDPGVIQVLGKHLPALPAQIACAAFVLVAGYFFKKRHDAAHG
jgi:YjbE family integral membrane protein